MGRTRSSAADIAEPLAGFDDFVVMASLMFTDMSQATTWTRLGTVTQQIAAKLIELRDGQDKKAGAPEILDSAPAVAPGKGGTRHPKGRTGDLDKGGTVQPNLLHGANWRLRRANAASKGTDNQNGEAHLPPLLASKSSTTTRPEADKRVRNSQ